MKNRGTNQYLSFWITLRCDDRVHLETIKTVVNMRTQSLIEGYFYKKEHMQSTSDSEQKPKQLKINYEDKTI